MPEVCIKDDSNRHQWASIPPLQTKERKCRIWTTASMWGLPVPACCSCKLQSCSLVTWSLSLSYHSQSCRTWLVNGRWASLSDVDEWTLCSWSGHWVPCLQVHEIMYIPSLPVSGEWAQMHLSMHTLRMPEHGRWWWWWRWAGIQFWWCWWIRSYHRQWWRLSVPSRQLT